MSHKICLITGATKGLGAFLARRFWDEGFSLCLPVRCEATLMKFLRPFPERQGQQIAYFVCDLAESASVGELITQVRASLPRLDVLINNAAIQGPIGPIGEIDFSLWQETIQVNLMTPVMLCHAFTPWMQERGSGSIINLSGGGATNARPNFSAYATAKAGLVRFSETLAEEVKASGIRVNCIAPGAMKTAMLDEILEKGFEIAGEREVAVASRVFAEGGASMDNVADLALFLASDASQGITGKLISAVWDDWQCWLEHLDELSTSDVYTLRRIAGRDRGLSWGDK